MGSQPIISWRHNTRNHFGRQHEYLTYEGYLSLVHPAWTTLYFLFGQAAYDISASRPEQLQKDKVTFTQKVPLLTPGGYFWYDQVAIPGTVDENGQLVSHLNYYRKLDRYERLLPSPPTVFAGGMPDPFLSDYCLAEGRKIVPAFLADFLTDHQVEFLLKYRQLAAVREGRKPTRQQGAIALDYDRLDGYDKIQQQIKKRLSGHFQGFGAETAHTFSCFLNDFFPLEN